MLKFIKLIWEDLKSTSTLGFKNIIGATYCSAIKDIYVLIKI